MRLLRRDRSLSQKSKLSMAIYPRSSGPEAEPSAILKPKRSIRLMPDETWPHGETDDPLQADRRNFYKFEKWRRDGRPPWLTRKSIVRTGEKRAWTWPLQCKN